MNLPRIGTSLLVPIVLFTAALIPRPADAGLSEATDAVGIWTSGGLSDNSSVPATPDLWAGQSVVALDGADAAEGRLDGSSGVEAWMESTFTGPSTLYFSYRVKDFSGDDPGFSNNGFFLSVDGVKSLISPDTGHINTDTGWQEGSASIPAGEHIVRWTLAYYGAVAGCGPMSIKCGPATTPDPG